MAEIDSLEVRVESDARSAVSSLNELETRLNRVAMALDRIAASNGLKRLAKMAGEATKGLANVQSKTKGMSSGIEPQIKQVSKRLEELTAKYKDLGKDFKFTGPSTAIEKEITKYTNALSRAKLKKSDFELSGKINSKGYESAIKDTVKFTNVLESLEKQLKETQKAEKSLGNVKQGDGWKKLSSSMETISKVFDGIKAGTSGVLNSIKKLKTGFSNMLSIIKKLSSSVGTLFSKLTGMASKAASAVTGSVRSMSNAFSKLSGSGNGINSASSGLSGLVKAAGGLLAAKGLFSFGKEAVKLGSDITEVENVVDTAFGSMKNKAYDFASTATEQFGLSELAAKQYSGTMMAMLQSSGVAQGAAADMSIELAGLAGNLASFFNIDTDTAFYKLRAGISGETEPLKQLGINMNIVNLEAFAMSQGIHKAYSEMTLAEQTILRYNYILDKTKYAQGDFAKTAGTWANQLRLLRLNIQSISAIIGQGLIAALLPAIKLLNKFMAKLTEAAKKFRDFMYVLFGKKIESPARGIVNDLASTADYTSDLSGISDSTEDISAGMEDAGWMTLGQVICQTFSTTYPKKM